jgi:hypothetical protein
MVNQLKVVLCSMAMACCLFLGVASPHAEENLKVSLSRVELDARATKRIDDRYLELTGKITDAFEDNAQISGVVKSFRAGKYQFDKDYNIRDAKLFTEGLYKNLEEQLYRNFAKVFLYDNSWSHSNVTPHDSDNRVKIIPGTTRNDGPTRVTTTFDIKLSKTWRWAGNDPSGSIVVKVKADYILENDQLIGNIQIVNVELNNPKVLFVQTVSTVSCNTEKLKELLNDLPGTVSYSARTAIKGDMEAFKRQIDELSQQKKTASTPKADGGSKPVAGGYKNEPDGFRGIKWGQKKSEVAGLSKAQQYTDGKGKLLYTVHTIQNDNLQLGGATLSELYYYFDANGTFTKVRANITSTGSFNTLLASLFERYGEPTVGKSANDSIHVWMGSQTKVALGKSANGGEFMIEAKLLPNSSDNGGF